MANLELTYQMSFYRIKFKPKYELLIHSIKKNFFLGDIHING